MFQCWESVPDKRPSFKTLYTNSSTIIEGVAGYLQMHFNPFTTGTHVGEEREEQTTEENVNGEEKPEVAI